MLNNFQKPGTCYPLNSRLRKATAKALFSINREIPLLSGLGLRLIVIFRLEKKKEARSKRQENNLSRCLGSHILTLLSKIVSLIPKFKKS
jgi:hypothetical protein